MGRESTRGGEKRFGNFPILERVTSGRCRAPGFAIRVRQFECVRLRGVETVSGVLGNE